jgi:hypothetical protein
VDIPALAIAKIFDKVEPNVFLKHGTLPSTHISGVSESAVQVVA